MPYKRHDPETNTTRIVPFIFGVGNHDLGVNSFGGSSIVHNSHEPVFKHYFPQNTDSGEIPSLNSRKSYFSHQIGEKLHVFSPDTEYEASMGGEQRDWMQQTLKDSTAQFKFTQYHGPIFAACEQDAYFDNLVMDAGKEHWVPLFDKYNMTIVFENHTHSFKRSKRIKHGKVDEFGTYYLGEGAWGVEKPTAICTPMHAELHDFSEVVQNVWMLEIDGSDIIQATAFGIDGRTLDSIKVNAIP